MPPCRSWRWCTSGFPGFGIPGRYGITAWPYGGVHFGTQHFGTHQCGTAYGTHNNMNGTSHTASRAVSYNPSHCLKLNGVNSMPLNSIAPIAESTRCPPTWSNFVAGTQDLATESCKGCGAWCGVNAGEASPCDDYQGSHNCIRHNTHVLDTPMFLHLRIFPIW